MSKMNVVDPVLKWFTKKMRAKLAKSWNQQKSSWHDMTFGELMIRLDNERTELDVEINAGGESRDIISEATGVANFAMMIADKARSEGGKG